MFNEVKLKRVEKLFNVKEDEAEFIIKNQAKYLKVHPAKLLSSYIVAHEEVARSIQRRVTERKVKSKNLYIRKYKDEIIEMYEIDGYGYLKISKALKINHNVNVSKSAIENFIKRNNLVKAEVNDG